MAYLHRILLVVGCNIQFVVWCDLWTGGVLKALKGVLSVDVSINIRSQGDESSVLFKINNYIKFW